MTLEPEQRVSADGLRLHAVVTDLDGVLTDTETIFFQAMDALLEEENLRTLGEDDARGFVGLDNESIWRGLARIRSLRLSLEEYTSRVDALARVRFERDLVPTPGATAFLADVRSRGLPLALATSAEHDWVMHRLELLGLSKAFDTVVTGDQVRNPKPDPEIYLTAVAALGVAPHEALGLEDSPSGIRSARAAGLFTVAVRTAWIPESAQADAHHVIGSLNEIDLDALNVSPRETGGVGR